MKYEIYNADCLEKLPEIPSNSIDLILADPPYQMTACEWDIALPFPELWTQLKRVIKKNGAILLFASQPFTTDLISSNRKWFKYCWYWNKVNGPNFLSAKYMPFKVIEEVCVFCEGKTTYNSQKTFKRPAKNARDKLGKFSKNNITNNVYAGINTKDKPFLFPVNLFTADVLRAELNSHFRLHPTQKPISFLSYLIKTFSNEGETVLDFCMGSASTGVACLDTKRKFIGIEKDKKYFDISKKRLEDHGPLLQRLYKYKRRG